MTQGTLIRYLSEMIWFPVAYLGDNVTWTAVDEQSADVALSDHGRIASGRVMFDRGRPTSFETMRYGGRWRVHIAAVARGQPRVRPRDGLNIPVRCDVSRILSEGLLTHGEFHIVEVAYNRPVTPFNCRANCGACCIARPFPHLSPACRGKQTGVHCIQLADDNRCQLFGAARRPAVCVGLLRPDAEMCGATAEEAMVYLGELVIDESGMIKFSCATRWKVGLAPPADRTPIFCCRRRHFYRHVSFSDTVRLNTSRSAVVSGSTQK